MSSILINDESIMIFNPKLAELLGLNESIILNHIHYWLERSNNIVEEKRWVYNSYEQWHEQIGFLSTSTIKKAIKKLEAMGIVLSGNFNKCKMDKTKWYTIAYDKLEKFFEGHKDRINEKEQSKITNEPMKGEEDSSIGSKLSEDESNSDKAIPYNTPEITHSDDNDNGFFDGKHKEDLKKSNFMRKDDLRGIILFYSENIRLPGSYELERLKYFAEEFKDSELIIFAMEQAINANARNLRYIEKTLYNWKDNGIKNKSEAEAFIENYKKYREGKGNGGLAGNYGKNKCCNSKNSPKDKWAGYKAPEPKVSANADFQGII
ncbi:DnaD domain-containing protein [Clostridium aciditolerans]|uniref:DnaD domain-containing protein n=1 Tax=Clostridium aciditolerans TaxID=339861 RepID=UPI001FEAA05E|nr:DnaD domain protein [Clostridium aciditolerans]